MSFKDRLAKMNETWAVNREERGSDFNAAFEDGVYAFQLQALELRESQNSGELMAVAEHYCTEGGPAGEVYMQFFNLEKENNAGKIWGQIFLAQLLEAMGYESPEDMGDMEETLAAVAADAPKYTARVRTNKEGYKNLSVVRILEQQAAPGKAGDNGEAAAPEEGEEAEQEAEQEPSEVGEHDADLQPLIEFCAAWNVDSKGGDVAAIVTELRTYEWKRDTLTPDEAALLERLQVPVKAAIAPPKAAPKATPKAAHKTAAKPKGKPSVAVKVRR